MIPLPAGIAAAIDASQTQRVTIRLSYSDARQEILIEASIHHNGNTYYGKDWSIELQ